MRWPAFAMDMELTLAYEVLDRIGMMLIQGALCSRTG